MWLSIGKEGRRERNGIFLDKVNWKWAGVEKGAETHLSTTDREEGPHNNRSNEKGVKM